MNHFINYRGLGVCAEYRVWKVDTNVGKRSGMKEHPSSMTKWSTVSPSRCFLVSNGFILYRSTSWLCFWRNILSPFLLLQWPSRLHVWKTHWGNFLNIQTPCPNFLGIWLYSLKDDLGICMPIMCCRWFWWFSALCSGSHGEPLLYRMPRGLPSAPPQARGVNTTYLYLLFGGN